MVFQRARIVDRSRFFKVVLVGKVLAVFRDMRRCTYFFDDGTRPRIEIRWWYRAWVDVINNITYVMENRALTDRLTCCKVHIWVIVALVPLHNPRLLSRFHNRIIGQPCFSSRLAIGKPDALSEFRNSTGTTFMECSAPHSMTCVSALGKARTSPGNSQRMCAFSLWTSSLRGISSTRL